VALTRPRYQAAVYTNSVAGLKQAVLSVDEKTSTIENTLDRKMAERSGKLASDITASVQPVKTFSKPQLRPEKKIDPGRELQR